jgi:hypothetical protein
MQIHHGKHHQAYVTNLNAALEKHPDLQSKSIEDLLRDIGKVPEDIRPAVRNNGGGHMNHSAFWKWMAPNAGGSPTGALGDGIKAAFGSFDGFKEQFTKAGVTRFVFSSTAATFGEPLSTPIDESHPKAPVSPYGRTKDMVETIRFAAACGVDKARLYIATPFPGSRMYDECVRNGYIPRVDDFSTLQVTLRKGNTRASRISTPDFSAGDVLRIRDIGYRILEEKDYDRYRAELESV